MVYLETKRVAESLHLSINRNNVIRLANQSIVLAKH